MIDSLYQSLLNRAADPAGEVYWMAYMASGHSENEVTIDMLGSAEHGFVNAPGNMTAQELNGIYLPFLGRVADPAGLKW